jgi:hypothetical protein
MYLPMFFVRQRFAMTTNRYELYAPDPGGGPEQLYGLAEQKRFAFKEQVTFFSDNSKTRPVFGFRARRTIDLNAGYDVTDEAGQPLGFAPVGLRREPAAVDLPRRGSGLRRNRAGA